MRATGILRRVDSLGRITLPMELRRTLDISEHDQLEIYLDEDRVILRKNEKSCIFCGSNVQLLEHHDKYICRECIQALKAD